MPDIPNSLFTRGTVPDEALIPAALSRVSDHDPVRLNKIARAVTDVLGFVPFSDRYAIAVLVLETLGAPESEPTPEVIPGTHAALDQVRVRRVSPDCRDGKHRACTREDAAWDGERTVDCDCECHEETE